MKYSTVQTVLLRLYNSNLTIKQENFLNTYKYVIMYLKETEEKLVNLIYHGINNEPENFVCAIHTDPNLKSEPHTKSVKIISYIETNDLTEKYPAAKLARLTITKLENMNQESLIVIN